VIELKIDKADVDRVINKLAQLDPKRKDDIAYKSFVDATAFIEQQLKMNISGKILKVRSGRLHTSIGSIVDDSGNQLHGIIGSGVRQGQRVPYADIHETGGTITPKRVNWLTIPLRAALTPAGMPRGRARDFENTFFAYSKAGNLILFQLKGKKAVALFLLKKSVTIPARRYMSITAEECAGQIADIMINRIDKELQGE
jgi:phage gpG-like protein